LWRAVRNSEYIESDGGFVDRRTKAGLGSLPTSKLVVSRPDSTVDYGQHGQIPRENLDVLLFQSDVLFRSIFNLHLISDSAPY
jgi:hypothetical protein